MFSVISFLCYWYLLNLFFLRDCLTKTKAYVAIHHSKALSLSIVRPPSKNIFIKGPVYKLLMKFSALYENLPWKVWGLSKELTSACSLPYLEKGRFTSKACVNFAVHNSFKVKCVKNWNRDFSSCVFCTL